MSVYEQYVTSQIIAGAIGGLLGAARNLKSEESVDDTFFQKIVSILIGTVFGIAAAEYFTSDLHPILSLIVGLAAGGVGGSALDVFQSTFPSIAATILQGWANRIGAGETKTKEYDRDEYDRDRYRRGFDYESDKDDRGKDNERY